MLAVGLTAPAVAQEKFELGKPNNDDYRYLDEYRALKEYIDYSKYPNFKLGAGTTVKEYLSNSLQRLQQKMLFANKWEETQKTGKKVSLQLLQQALASLKHVAPCGLKVAGVPWVGHVARTVGEIEQQADFPLGVTTTDAGHVAQVPRVHAYQQVEAVVVAPCHLPGRLALAPYTVLGKFATCRRVHLVAYLLGRGGSRLYVEVMLQAGLRHKMFHHKLGHGTAADVTVADEEYACRAIHSRR